MREIIKGKLVVYEGIDGCGKTTQQEMMVARLKNMGIKVACGFEHTRGPYGLMIRGVVDEKTRKMDGLDLQRLFIKDRAWDTEMNIRPAIAEGRLCLWDRYDWSTIAYGGVNYDRAMLKVENEAVIVRPRLRILVDVPAEIAMQRMDGGRKRVSIFEEKMEFLESVRGVYKWLAETSKEDCMVVDGIGDSLKIHETIFEALVTRKIIG